jgi:hypothetical protein
MQANEIIRPKKTPSYVAYKNYFVDGEHTTSTTNTNTILRRNQHKRTKNQELKVQTSYIFDRLRILLFDL